MYPKSRDSGFSNSFFKGVYYSYYNSCTVDGFDPGFRSWNNKYVYDVNIQIVGGSLCLIKYRRGGKTLCALYARENCIGFMVILGKDEREKFEAGRNEYSESVRKIYTHRAHRILYPSGGRAPRDKV
ncbi:DUF3788 family protein [Anaerostipes hominis (ex Lee et al. 2021)]|uniref:DUF3788 family protein n=1 Tax=Anaerostipes TaxID=207244 RepID=UPI0035146566